VSGADAQRLVLTLAYDGRAFPGWQTQPSRSAIQDHLEAAIARIAGHRLATICAGRTDAGVHALRQVVHFDSPVDRPETAWVRGVNAHLPEAIAVRQVTPATTQFHARFGAMRRRYHYLLHRSPVRHPLLAGRVGWSFREVDACRLAEATSVLVGEHDFSAFRSSQCQAASPVRRLEAIEVSERGPFVLMTFVGNAFLHHMIRNLVGSLLMVADGRRSTAWLGEVLAARDRRLAAPTFEPGGLYFDGAQYPEQFGVPSWAGEGAGALLAAFV
jgi:tRNA pseudouridine38-40 synthase